MLGDRIRLADHFLDPGVFIRSMATRGSLGGLAEAALQAALLMDAAGKDDVLLETVGVGQGEIDIVDHADTIVLALMPGSGDSIQALKAGRDGDPRRDRRQQGRPPAGRHDGPRGAVGCSALGPQGDWKVPVVRTEAAKGEGIAELLEQIDAHREHIDRDRHAGRAPGPQPARRGAGHRRGPASPPTRGASDERSGLGGAARRASSRRETDPASAARSCWRRSTMPENRPRCHRGSTWMAELELLALRRRWKREPSRRAERSELRGDHRQPGVLAGVA